MRTYGDCDAVGIHGADSDAGAVIMHGCGRQDARSG